MVKRSRLETYSSHHFMFSGAICCYSCRAFFRRSGHRKYVCVDRKHQCDVTPNNRKQCKLCRYTRCIAVGMKPEMVDATLEKRKHEQEEQTPDSTTNMSDEDIAEDVDVKNVELNISNSDVENFNNAFMKTGKEDFKEFQLNYKNDEYIQRNKNIQFHNTKFEDFTVLRLKQYGGVSDKFSDVEEVEMKKPITKSGSINQWEHHSPNQVSVIKKNPIKSDKDDFPASFMNNLVPFKKRDSVKEWIPYCQKLSLSLQGSPSVRLTCEESMFIDQRVSETKALVQILHENCMKYMDENKAYTTALGFDLEKEHCVEIFRAKAGAIFCNPLSNKQNQTVEEIYNTNLVKSRFFCCAMAAMAIRLFGGPDVDCFPHDHEFYQKYTFLLKSPWASSLEQERDVENTLRELGATIGSDKRLEVLFTSAIMRGFRDQAPPVCTSPDGDMTSVQTPLASRLPGLLTGTQFSLLLHRYLKDTRSQVHAVAIFQKLERLIPPLYEASNVFYFGRLNF